MFACPAQVSFLFPSPETHQILTLFRCIRWGFPHPISPARRSPPSSALSVYDWAPGSVPLFSAPSPPMYPLSWPKHKVTPPFDSLHGSASVCLEPNSRAGPLHPRDSGVSFLKELPPLPIHPLPASKTGLPAPLIVARPMPGRARSAWRRSRPSSRAGASRPGQRPNGAWGGGGAGWGWGGGEGVLMVVVGWRGASDPLSSPPPRQIKKNSPPFRIGE